MSQSPFLTLVVPVLNRAAMIVQALDSVARQPEAEIVEILVVDGGSTDGTLDAVQQFRGYCKVTLIEASGTSIYQAENLGLQAARGKVIGNLNSDDWLAPGAIGLLVAAFQSPDVRAVQGRASIRDETGGVMTREGRSLEYPGGLSWMRVMLGSPAINALFVRADVFDEIGLFDEGFRLAADRDWMLRLLRASIRVHTIDEELYCYRSHGESATISGSRAADLMSEYRRIVTASLGPASSRLERRAARAWLAHQVGHAVRDSVRDFDIRGIFRSLGEAGSVDPFWPVGIPSWINWHQYRDRPLPDESRSYRERTSARKEKT